MRTYKPDLMTLIARWDLTESEAERLHEKRMMDIELDFLMQEAQRGRKILVRDILDKEPWKK